MLKLKEKSMRTETKILKTKRGIPSLCKKKSSLGEEVRRPWGNYVVLNVAHGFKVKLVQVLPYKRLSLQRHKFRSEHWVVVEGKAKVVNGKKTFYLEKNQSTYIPKGEIHRLENPTDKLLKIIEVQCGEYTEEDDIERLEDDFGRDKLNHFNG